MGWGGGGGGGGGGSKKKSRAHLKMTQGNQHQEKEAKLILEFFLRHTNETLKGALESVTESLSQEHIRAIDGCRRMCTLQCILLFYEGSTSYA